MIREGMRFQGGSPQSGPDDAPVGAPFVFFPTARSAVIAESGLDVAHRACVIGAQTSFREDTEDSVGGHVSIQIHCAGPHPSGASVSRC
jgi:hypothetical protein